MSEDTYYNPVQVIQTDDWLASCWGQLSRLKIERPLVVTSAGSLQRLGLDRYFDPDSIFADVTPNPTLPNCQRAIDFSRSGDYDGVLALGGGSVMDTAKCTMASLGTGKANIGDLMNIAGPYPGRVPAVFIPTTHGSASEVTMWGTIWDLETKQKHSISHPDLYPDVALQDGRLTLTLSLDTSLISCLDALSHSFEAIWNKHANPRSTEYALDAIIQILETSPRLKVEPDNLEVRKRLLSAATNSGLAFSNTRTAAAHSISYPLTAHYGIPHGIASSLSLVPLLEINGPSIENLLARIFYHFNLEGTAELRAKIEQIPEGILKYRLLDWGVEHEDLDWLVTQSFTEGRMDNNIVDPLEQVRWVLGEIY